MQFGSEVGAVDRLAGQFQALKMDPIEDKVAKIFANHPGNPEAAAQDLVAQAQGCSFQETGNFYGIAEKLLKGKSLHDYLRCDRVFVMHDAVRARQAQLEPLAVRLEQLAGHIAGALAYLTIPPEHFTTLRMQRNDLSTMLFVLGTLRAHAMQEGKLEAFQPMISIFSQNPSTPEDALRLVVEYAYANPGKIHEILTSLPQQIARLCPPNFYARYMIATLEHDVSSNERAAMTEQVETKRRLLAKLQEVKDDGKLSRERIDEILSSEEQELEAWRAREKSAPEHVAKDVEEIQRTLQVDLVQGLLKWRSKQTPYTKSDPRFHAIEMGVHVWVSLQSPHFQARFKAAFLRHVAPDHAGHPLLQRMLVRFADRFEALGRDVALEKVPFTLLEKECRDFTSIYEEVGVFQDRYVAQELPGSQAVFALDDVALSKLSSFSLSLYAFWSQYKSEGRDDDADSVVAFANEYIPCMRFEENENDELAVVVDGIPPLKWQAINGLASSHPKRHLRIILDSKKQATAVWVSAPVGQTTQWIQFARYHNGAWRLCTGKFTLGKISSPPVVGIDAQDKVHLVWLQAHHVKATDTWSAPRVYKATLTDREPVEVTVIPEYGCSNLHLTQGGAGLIAEYQHDGKAIKKRVK